VKAFVFILASVAYAILVYFIALFLALQCGLGPDSSVVCNAKADRQVFSFAVGAIVFYAVLSVGYWWPRKRSKG
jgi:hypothetical protein